jgi:phospholipid/cholesterol/gamma-HCH transport system substrate-binding protein
MSARAPLGSARERVRLGASAVGLALSLVLCLAYLFTDVLDLPLTSRPDSVTVHLERTGGLFEGSPVTYRGSRVGTVTSIRLDPGAARGSDDEVVATVSLRPEAEVPRDTRAVVRSLSPVGEQFLDLQPDSPDGPFLGDGDVVRAEATDLPVSLASAVGGLDNLLSRVDGRDVRVVLRELAAATDGTGDDLDSLLGSASKLVTALDETWPETERLLVNGERVGLLLERNTDRLASFSGSARRFARWLRDYDPQFRAVLRRGAEDLDVVDGLVVDLQRDLPRTLEALVSFTDLLYDREPHVRWLTSSLGYGTNRFASAFEDGWLRVDLNIQGQRQCLYDTERSEGHSVDRRPLNRDGHCELDDEVWRGAEHALPPLDR